MLPWLRRLTRSGMVPVASTSGALLQNPVAGVKAVSALNRAVSPLALEVAVVVSPRTASEAVVVVSPLTASEAVVEV